MDRPESWPPINKFPKIKNLEHNNYQSENHKTQSIFIYLLH